MGKIWGWEGEHAVVGRQDPRSAPVLSSSVRRLRRAFVRWAGQRPAGFWTMTIESFRSAATFKDERKMVGRRPLLRNNRHVSHKSAATFGK